MSHPAIDTGPRQMSIGLIAYGMDGHDPSKVLVRVPTERGRWVLTDRCVVEVPCTHCKAVVGEPCRRGRQLNSHGAGTHAVRRTDWQALRRKEYRNGKPVPKLRVRPDDLDARHPDDEFLEGIAFLRTRFGAQWTASVIEVMTELKGRPVDFTCGSSPGEARYRSALERIASYRLPQFAGPHDMALACVDDARRALEAAEVVR